MYIMYINLKN